MQCWHSASSEGCIEWLGLDPGQVTGEQFPAALKFALETLVKSDKVEVN
jgi:hypothetical protein